MCPCHTKCRIAANFCLISDEIGLDDPTLCRGAPANCGLHYVQLFTTETPRKCVTRSFIILSFSQKNSHSGYLSFALYYGYSSSQSTDTPPPLSQNFFRRGGVRREAILKVLFEITDYHPKLVWSACVCRATRY